MTRSLQILSVEQQRALSVKGQANYALFLCLNRAQPVIAARYLTDALEEHRTLASHPKQEEQSRAPAIVIPAHWELAARD